MKTCPICDTELPGAGSRRVYCSVPCRRTAERRRAAELRAAPFRAVAGTTRIADREEVMRLLTVAARNGSVAAIRTLLEELRRSGGDTGPLEGIIDELARKRKPT